MFNQLLQPVISRVFKQAILQGKATGCTLDRVKHSKQKEVRIIDTLEPVIANHKLVINRDVLDEDFSSIQEMKHIEEAKRQYYSGFYQLTHISKDRGSLKHDDRVDALAIAVAYYTDKMARDSEVGVEEFTSQAIKDALRRRLEHATVPLAERRVGKVLEVTGTCSERFWGGSTGEALSGDALGGSVGGFGIHWE